MGAFQVSIDIACTPTTVFPLVAEPSSMKRWYEAVVDVTVTTDGPTRRGTTYRLARSLPGGSAANVVEITEYDPDRHVTHESLGGPTPFRYSYTLEPTLEGTRVVLDGRISGAGILGAAAPADHLATELFKRGMRKNLAVLKQLAERRS
jgi:uncharacterized protein YndB with AHSA1/START domain